MSNYIAEGTYEIVLQEGDGGGPDGACTVEFIVPDEIDMTNRIAKFMIRKAHNVKPIIVKYIGNGITKSGQNIIVSFVPNDTKGKCGNYLWDLEVFTTGLDVITIGRGTVKILTEITTQ